MDADTECDITDIGNVREDLNDNKSNQFQVKGYEVNTVEFEFNE